MQTDTGTICQKTSRGNQRAATSGFGGRGNAGRALHATVLLACAGVLTAACLLQVDGQGLHLLGCRWPLRCGLHEITGVKCALCGMSRSFCSLAHGDVRVSLGFHRLGPVVFALLVVEIGYRLLILSARGRRLCMAVARFHHCAVACVCVALFGNWLIYLGGLFV